MGRPAPRPAPRLAPSDYTAMRHRAAGFKPPIHVLPLFSAMEPQSAGSPSPGRPRFLFVGRLSAPKGILPLLEAFVSLPAYDLLVIGDGELRGELERRFASYPNIRFQGRIPQSDLIAAYQGATALIASSL